MNIENLTRLAAYLEGLPVDYPHFNMRCFTDNFDGTAEAQYARENGGLDLYGCNTVACAVGHGPSAGMLFLDSMFMEDVFWSKAKQEWIPYYKPDWNAYCTHFFLPINEGEDDDGPINPQFEWCFGGRWAYVDNHHWSAAARIRYLIAHRGNVPIAHSTDIDEDLLPDYERFRHQPLPEEYLNAE